NFLYGFSISCCFIFMYRTNRRNSFSRSCFKRWFSTIDWYVRFLLSFSITIYAFALFPGWLNSLPRSGGWMNSVKVSLGFLELALALKFLSNADLVLQLGWLE